MPFASCTTGTVALCQQDDGSTLAVVVEAWDEAGAPYVAGQSGLVAAASLPGFVRLEAAAAIIPPPALPPTVVPATRVERGTRPARERDPQAGQ